MAQKLLKTKKSEVAPRKDAGRETGIVLVGTYGAAQMEKWILPKGYYNYPVGDEDDCTPAHCGRIRELWLYKGKGARKVFSAEFLGVKTRAELPDYPAAQAKPHGEKYLLFKVKELYGPQLENAAVHVRVSDFAKRSPKIAAAVKAFQEGSKAKPEPAGHLQSLGGAGILAEVLPGELAQVPPERLCIREDGVQLDFFSVLDDIDFKMSAFKNRPKNDKTLRFIDLFAGIGGVRKGFEQACEAKGIKTLCVFTSEIKPHAIDVLKQNHPDELIHGDITKVDEKSIPEFDVLLGGFPCQAFSAAGKRLGFEDTRGTLFFDVARIIKEKKPRGFVLENVEGLVNHDKKNPKDEYGHTLKVILATLDELGYKVSWRVLNASEFGVPQDRKRIYIVGARKAAPNLEKFDKHRASINTVLEHGKETAKSKFIDKLLAHYSVAELEGKAIKDKRGGADNIHSWDFEYKGRVSARQRELLNTLLKERRKHQWAEQYGIDWMDGMPLTLEMIQTFFKDDRLEEMLEDLVAKRYVVKEHPKRKVKEGKVFIRVQDPTLPLGYNIVAGKMSFEISKIMSPDEIAPTLVAMDMQHLYVVDGEGLRNLTLREGLGMFGYPKDFKFNVSRDLGYDLLGNTVVVPVIKAVAGRLLDAIK